MFVLYQAALNEIRNKTNKRKRTFKVLKNRNMGDSRCKISNNFAIG